MPLAPAAPAGGPGPAVIVGAITLVLPLFWCGVVWLVGTVGGWRALAGVYRAWSGFEGES